MGYYTTGAARTHRQHTKEHEERVIYLDDGHRRVLSDAFGNI